MKRTRLKRKSKKQAAIDRAYKFLRGVYLEVHPYCEFEIGENCMCSESRGVTVHHVRGRGIHTLDVNSFMTVCRFHHHWIHFEHPGEARKKGYIKS